ncbi:hypothetical protein [Actinoplanes sp. CA-252034]|uniref:hypothetical protein n=1 Tax=Actinoplanes sp. CA-252034 TaxID=3239906 RepID=UPI003D96A5CF
MSTSTNRPATGRSREEIEREDPPKVLYSKEMSSQHPEGEAKQKLDEALHDAEKSAEEKGMEAAQEFSRGVIHGLGARAGQAVWDFLEELLHDS